MGAVMEGNYRGSTPGPKHSQDWGDAPSLKEVYVALGGGKRRSTDVLGAMGIVFGVGCSDTLCREHIHFGQQCQRVQRLARS